MKESTRTLSEHASVELLRDCAVPTPRERLAVDAEEAVSAALEIGLPVALKLCGDRIAHKTERDLVRLELADSESVRKRSEPAGRTRVTRARRQYGRSVYLARVSLLGMSSA